MKALTQLFNRHYLIVLLALLVSVLTGLPQIIAARHAPGFIGIYKTINNDDLYYLARGQDIIDGHSFLSNPYLYEHKEGWPMQMWLPDYLLAKPLALLGLDIHQGYIFYDFLWPGVMVILSYAIIYHFTRRRDISWIGATFLHLTLFLYDFNRSPSPQFNFIFWLALFLAWLYFLERSTWPRTLLVGLILGSLFYIYPYYWTFYVVFFGTFLFLGLLARQSLPWTRYGLVFLVALLLALPHLVIMFKSSQLPFYQETLARVGMIETHFPSGRKIVMWGALVFLAFSLTYKRLALRIDRNFIFFGSGICASMLVVNHHLITGQNLQFSSHYWQLSVFVFVFTACYMLFLWLPKLRSKRFELLTLAFLVILILFSPFKYVAYLASGGLNYTEREIAQQRYASLFSWLRDNTRKDEVVYANNDISVLVPIYTANNIFFQGLANLHFMSDQEVWERFVLNNYWDKIDNDYAVKNRFSIWGAYYPTSYDHNQSKNKIRRWLGLPEKTYIKYPPEAINEFLNFAHEIQKRDFQKQIDKYRVDYFVYDKRVDQWPIVDLDFLVPVAVINEFSIYRVK